MPPLFIDPVKQTKPLFLMLCYLLLLLYHCFIFHMSTLFLRRVRVLSLYFERVITLIAVIFFMQTLRLCNSYDYTLEGGGGDKNL
jgi:hypothetical protein